MIQDPKVPQPCVRSACFDVTSHSLTAPSPSVGILGRSQKVQACIANNSSGQEVPQPTSPLSGSTTLPSLTLLSLSGLRGHLGNKFREQADRLRLQTVDRVGCPRVPCPSLCLILPFRSQFLCPFKIDKTLKSEVIPA